MLNELIDVPHQFPVLTFNMCMGTRRFFACCWLQVARQHGGALISTKEPLQPTYKQEREMPSSDKQKTLASSISWDAEV
jgi:hypothetical protein